MSVGATVIEPVEIPPRESAKLSCCALGNGLTPP